MAFGSLHTDPLSGSATADIELDLCVVHCGQSSSSLMSVFGHYSSPSFILRGEATPADSLDVQVLALKTGSDFCLEGKGYEKGQMGHAMSEMRDLDFHLFTVKLNRTAWGPGRAFLISFGLKCFSESQYNNMLSSPVTRLTFLKQHNQNTLFSAPPILVCAPFYTVY